MTDEIAYLKNALQRSVETHYDDAIKKQHQEMLDLLIQHENDTQDTDDSYPVFTATLNYMATGEGHTMKFFAQRASSKAEWLVNICEKIGGYYALGVEIYEGLPPDTDLAFKALVSPAMKKLLEREIAPGIGGYIDILVEQHVNYS